MEYRQALAAGTLLAGEYRINGTLRQDGFCITYDAEDLQLKQHVLVKEYFPAEVADRVRLSTVRPKSTRQVGVLSWGRQRFIEEAQTLTKFSHPGIARMKRVFEENNTAYAVVDAEDWPTLLSWTDKLRRQPTQGELDQVAKQLLDALEVLHDAKVLVRDLSPESIFIRDKRQLVLVDFGTAKAQLAARARKMHAVVRPGYSAPEQYLFDDDQQGPWTDIFSLGAVLYRLFTGRSPVEVIHRHHSDDMAKAAAGHVKSYRLEFLQAIDQAMALSPADRPQTVKAWRTKLLDSGRSAQVKPAETSVKPAAPPAKPQSPASPEADQRTDAATPAASNARPAAQAQEAPQSSAAITAGNTQSTPTMPAARAAPTAEANPQASPQPTPPSDQPAATRQAPSPAAPPPAATVNTASATAGQVRAAPRIPASAIPSGLLSEKAAEEDSLGFTALDNLPEPEPEPPAPAEPTTKGKSAEKENPIKSDPARSNEVDAMAFSNRRFMMAVVGIMVGLISIIGLGLVTLERTLRQDRPATAQDPAERLRMTDQERLKAEQKQQADAQERKRRDDEAKRSSESELKRQEEAARLAQQKRLDAEAERRRQDDAQQKRLAEEADRKRQEDAQQKRVAEEADRKRQDDAQQKRIAEDADRKRQDDARQKRIAEEADRKRQDDAQQKRIAEEADRKRQEDAQQKRLAEDAERKRQEDTQQKRLADEAERKRQQDTQQKRLAEEVERRRQEDAQQKRLAEETDRRRQEDAKQKWLAEEEAKRKNDLKRQAEATAEQQRIQAEQQLANQIAAESNRDNLLRIATQNPAQRAAIERRLIDLGYFRFASIGGDTWRKPGAGEAFQDCPTCALMVVVPAGQFLMGSPASESGRQEDEDDAPGPGGGQVKIAIPQPFAVSRFEITRGQFSAFVAETQHKMDGGCYVRVDAFELFPDLSWQSPGFPQDNEHPVACVSWLDAKAFAAWMSKKTGRTYRLLSEAEWEYAARGAPRPVVQPRFPFGTADKDLCAFGNGADLAAKRVYPSWQVARCNDGYDHTSPVGSFEPNATGLHDMLGNVWEWIEDCYHDSYRGQPAATRNTGSPFTEGCNQGLRVLRGGSWSDQPESLRPASRIAIPNDKRIQIGGFRLARTLEP